jgi:acyl carrier protein phosphodiesterase
MNFLDHLYLSGDNPAIQVGNFIGDFVKGKNLSDQFEPGIVKGIDLHRAIDEYTDHHPVVFESKIRLRSKYRHYAPVLVDMYYDHILARNWNDYHDMLLPDYADQVYATLESYKAILPMQVNHMLPYMIRGNWLVNYGKIEGIKQALTGMSRRTKFKSNMEKADEDLLEHYDAFENEFRLFFPDLVTFAKEFFYPIE